MHYKFSNMSIKLKLLLTILPLLMALLLIREMVVISNLDDELSIELDSRLNESNELVYNLLNQTFSNSLKNYLRGRVDDAVYSFEAVFSAYKRGAIPIETAMSNLKRGLSARKIGESGYFFVLDEKGVVVFHPIDEYIGRDFSSEDFIARQLEIKEGYGEYVWQNANESVPFPKAMYTKPFPLMGWLIGIVAYRKDFENIIDFEKMKETLLKNGESGNSTYSILNNRKEVLLQTTSAEESLIDFSQLEITNTIIEEYESNGKDKGVFPFTFKGKEYRLSYSWIPDFDWVIISARSLDKFYKPISDLRFLFYITDFLLLIVVATAIYVLISYILKPLERFTNELFDSEILKNADLVRKGDELQIASNVFNYYTDKINQDKIESKKIADENRLMAEFPNRIEQPVLRIDDNYFCNYMNIQARKDLYPFQINENILDFLGEDFENVLIDPKIKSIEKQLLGLSYRITVTSIPDHSEKYLHFFDLTFMRKLSTLQSVWDNVFDTSIEGITITDDQGYVERINASFTKITGYEEKDIIGEPVNRLKSRKQDRSFFTDMWNSLIETGQWKGKIWNRKKNGEIYLEWLSISSFVDSRTGLRKYMAIFHDISEVYEKEQEIEFIYTHDILTKLPGRRLFYDRLDQMLYSSIRTKDTCAVIILDINKFSRINEYLGMKGGDAVLVKLSTRLTESLRQEDTIARLGSDHYGLLLPRLTSNENSLDIISRLQKTLQEPLFVAEKTVKPVVNMGISLFPNDGETAEILISKANTALEKSKKIKPGIFQFFDSKMQQEISKWIEFEEALKVALDNKEFVLHYQPKVSFETGDLDGFEALIRWNRGEVGLISPGWFIPKLEENGLIVEVGNWIIEGVCCFINKLLKVYERDFKVGINISAKQFINADFLDNLRNTIERNNIEPRFIDLEITENIAATEISTAISTIGKLRDQGYSISIDDFGTGYSSLKYLKDLDFTTLKIDKSFVDPLPGDKKSLSIVKSIIDLAKNLDKNIVVEGVESKEQAVLFKEMECDVLQGFYFSRPLTESDALALASSINVDIQPLI